MQGRITPVLGSALGFVLRLLGTLVLCVVSLVLHLPTRVGRLALGEVAREAVVLAPGTVRFSRIDAFGPGLVRISGLSWHDHRGDPVVEGATVELRHAWRIVPALLHGTALPDIRVHAATAWIRVPALPPEAPLDPNEPPPPPSTLQILAPHVELQVDRLHSALEGVEGRGRDLYLESSLVYTPEGLSADVHALRIEVTPRDLGPHRVAGSGRVSTFPPGRLDARLSIVGDTLRCGVNARSDREGHIATTFENCIVPPGALDRALRLPPTMSLPAEVQFARVHAEGTLGGEWEVTGTVVVGGQRADLHAAIGPQHQRIELALHTLMFQPIAPWLPPGRLGGVVILDRWQEGDTQRLVLDASRLEGEVAGVPVPPLRAEAHVTGQRIRLDSLQVPDLDLTARGTFDLSHAAPTFHAEVELDSPDLADIPWVRRRVHGRIRMTARGDALDGRIRAELGATVSNLQVAGIRVGSGNVRARVTEEDPFGAVDVSGQVRGLFVPGGLGPFDVNTTVTGNPHDTLVAQVHVSGAGLTAPLPPLAPGTVSGRSAVDLRAAVHLRDPARLRVDLTHAQVSLRGAQSTVTGSVDLPRGSTGSQGLLGTVARVHLRTPHQGTVALGLRRGSFDVTLSHFDLAWLGPIVGPLGVAGQLDGSLRLDPRRPAASGGTLALHHGSLGRLEDLEATVSLERDAQRPSRSNQLRLRAGIRMPRGVASAGGTARIDLELGARPPRSLSNLRGWYDGLDDARLTVAHIDLGAFREFVPTGIALQGRLDAGVLVDRETADGPVRVRASVEGREATVGINVGFGQRRRMSPAVVPMHLRAVVCTQLEGPRVDSPPLTLRVGLGPDRGEAEVAPPDDCAGETPLLSASLLALSGSLGGPWMRALGALAGDLSRPSPVVSAATRSLLEATPLDATLAFGPLRRADWPLRTFPYRTADGSVATLRPPDVPPDMQVQATLHAHGALLRLETDLELEATTPSLPAAGLEEPITVRAFGAVAPAPGETLFETVNLQLGLLGALSPALPRPEQGRIEADLRVTTSLRDLQTRGADGLRVRRFDIDTDNIHLERVAWARARGLHGAVDVDVNGTEDAQRPINARISVRGLRSQTRDPLGRLRQSPSVNSFAHATLVRNGGGWQMRGCMLATLVGPTGSGGLSAAAAGQSPLPTCDPINPRAVEAGALGVSVSMPLVGEGAITSLRPQMAAGQAEMSARGFSLETLSPFVPEEYASELGGTLEAYLRWRGAEANVMRGRLAVRDGRVTITAVGEPVRNLDFAVVADGPEIRIERANFAMGRGRMDLTGSAQLADDVLARVQLRGQATDLPVVSAGNTWGWLHGVVRVGLTIRSDATEGTVDVDTARVLVQEQPPRDLQPLDPDPDIFIFGRTTLAAPQLGGAYAVRIHYQTHTPVWLRRSDFALAATARGTFVRDRAGNAISGVIELASTQSWFSIFGKRFDFERMRVSLDGNVVFNPELNIAAHYDSPTAGRIDLTVTGRFQSPTVVFRAERYPAASQAEVLAMIVVGRSQGTASTGQSDLASQAGAAVGSLLTGLTLGAFTSSLSREFNFLPTLIVEPGSGANRGRYGAGVNLSPRIYLQATYGAASAGVGQTTSALAEEFRLLLEYAITESITGSATWGTPSNRWGVDLFWSP